MATEAHVSIRIPINSAAHFFPTACAVGFALSPLRGYSGCASQPREGPVKKSFKRHARTLLNIWPPFLGAGIHITRLAADWKEIDVEMKLRWWNANYVGTHYGGSLYSMADPFFMVMLIENLGKDYIVWDKAASIRFKKPGRGKMTASFRLSGEQIQEIRDALQSRPKIERVFTVAVKNESGDVVAEVEKLLHIRKKDLA
jgi:hypothetical protein